MFAMETVSNSFDNESDDSNSESLIETLFRYRNWYRNNIYSPIEDTSIIWGRRLVIASLSITDAINEFRFRKKDLQKVADLLWPKMSSFLVGERDRIRVQGKYKVPYETGLLLLLFQLSRPRRICPKMERFFGMRKSHISAVLQTFSRALQLVSEGYLGDPIVHFEQFTYYSTLISTKAGRNVKVWGFIDGTV